MEKLRLMIENYNDIKVGDIITINYYKKDNESGYPGNVLITVTYKLDNNNNLHIKYNATTDKDTIVNLTNHTYFNLNGAQNSQSGSILNHSIKLPNSSKITPINSEGIPTGEFMQIKETPFDFTEKKKISSAIDYENEQIKFAKGFDHNYCVNEYDGKKLIDIAEIESEESGIKLKISSNLPGFQFYTANNLGKSAQPNGKDGRKYEKQSTLCIEPQFYPNAINTKTFLEKGILKAGNKYNREIVYSFSN